MDSAQYEQTIQEMTKYIGELAERVHLLERSTIHAIDPTRINFLVVQVSASISHHELHHLTEVVAAFKGSGIHTVVVLPPEISFEFYEHEPPTK